MTDNNSVSGGAPALPIDGQNTLILRLYLEHCRIAKEAAAFFEAGNGIISAAVEELMDRLFYNRRDEIEEQMMASPCTCAADFAAKAIVWTAKGRVFGDWETDPLWTEARHLVDGAAA